MTKEEALKTYYGYDAFRGGQEAVIDALLSGRDALAIMPTGAGKSVCYQIPALLLPGITLVVSPLVSLMRDQVTQLVQMGIPAAFLNSSLTFRQYLLELDRAKAGRYKIIYVAPERLETEGFQSFVREADISLVAVDEAHCISPVSYTHLTVTFFMFRNHAPDPTEVFLCLIWILLVVAAEAIVFGNGMIRVRCV